MTSLGTTVPADQLSVLITQVVSPKHAEDEPVAEKALKAASVRMADREACSTKLAAAMEHASVPTKIALVRILAAVGGTKALATVGAVGEDRQSGTARRQQSAAWEAG